MNSPSSAVQLLVEILPGAVKRVLKNTKMKSLLLAFVVLTVTSSLLAQSATVTWTTTFQTMDGWGASTGYNERNTNLTPAQADCFFSVTTGSCITGNIGLEYIRIQDNTIPASAPDLPTLLLAVARGTKVFLSFNGTELDSGSYASQAAYMVAKTQFFISQGVPIATISPMNEPVNSGTSAAALDTFIASYLQPALTAAGLSIPITLGEGVEWFTTDYVTPCMNDTNCKPFVTTVAGHDYGTGSVDGFGFVGTEQCCSTYTPPPSSAAGKKVWMTEVQGGFNGPCASDSGSSTFDSSMADALVWAHNIHDFLTVAGGSSWQYWNLAAETSHGLPDCNDGLTSSSYVPTQRYYAVGNWSKFVRNGWVRIDATASPASGIYVSAFKDTSSGNFAIVAINQNSSPSTVAFSLAAFPSVTSVTPTVTSASINLVDQVNATVSGGAFSFSLPATSVTTFRGTASATSPTIPLPPTNLTESVH
jgi:glucuronoarabinoxylan endo-1,4-beta-xylanase